MKKNKFILIPVMLCLVACGNNNPSTSTSILPSLSTSISVVPSVEPIVDKNYVLDNQNIPEHLSSRSTFVEEITSNNRNLLLTYENVEKYNDGHVKVAKDGLIKNSEALKGIKSVSFAINGGKLNFWYGHSIADINYETITESKEISFTDTYSFFKICALEDTNLTKVSFTYTGENKEDYSYAKIYDDSFTLLETKECKVGGTYDVKNFKKPNLIYYEETEIPFLGYALENGQSAVESYVATNDNVAFYPTYAFVQRFSWDHDRVNKTYTSIKKGIRSVSEVEGSRYGRFSCDFELSNFECTSLDLCFNMTIGPNSYPYETTDGSSYYALHLNPKVGGFSFAIDGKADDPTYSGWHNLASLPITSPSMPKIWKEYWTNWYNSGNPTAPLKCSMEAEFTPNSVALYVNNTHLFTYIKEAGRNLLDSSLVGVRANTAGAVAKNFTFTKYESESNGFNVFSDGSYVSYIANSTTLIPSLGGKYGKFETDITYFNSVNTNSRTGLLLRAKREEEGTSFTANSGFYMHSYISNNGSGNVNFTTTTIYDNTYAKRPGGATGNIGVLTYAKWTDGVNEFIGSGEKLEAYFNRNVNFSKGLTPNFTVHAAFELTDSSISMYIDGELVKSYTTAITCFDSLADYLGVGFLTAVAGTRFTNYRWTSYEK